MAPLSSTLSLADHHPPGLLRPPVYMPPPASSALAVPQLALHHSSSTMSLSSTSIHNKPPLAVTADLEKRHSAKTGHPRDVPLEEDSKPREDTPPPPPPPDGGTRAWMTVAGAYVIAHLPHVVANQPYSWLVQFSTFG